MSTTARVLIVEQGGPRSLSDKLDASGYRSLRAVSESEALIVAGVEQPDVVIVNGAASDRNFTDLPRKLKDKPDSARIPVILITGADQEALARALIGADDHLRHPFLEVELMTRLDSLVRLHTMQEELTRRIETSARYGVAAVSAVVPPEAIADARIMIVGADPEPIGALCAVLGEMARLSVHNHTYDALRHLGQEDFDCVVLAVGRQSEDYAALSDDMRANSRLFNTPILAVVDEAAGTTTEAAFGHGANDALTVPWDADDLWQRALTLVKQQRYRAAMQSVYREARHFATSDSLTGLYNHGFLHAHLQVQIDAAHRWDRQLSVGYFDIADMAGLNRRFGYVAGDSLLRQVGGLIGTLVRGEDLPARIAGEEFCVVQPDTPPAAARVALERIAGVVDNTDFALSGLAEPARIHLQIGSAALAPGDGAAELLARARAQLR